MALPDQQLTEKQALYVRQVAQGTNHTEAARQAGYAFPEVDGYRLSRLPHIQRAVQAFIDVALMGDLQPMAFATLKRLMGEANAGPVQLGAAKAVLAHVVTQRPGDASKRDFGSMTIDELEAELARIQASRAAAAIDITPALAPIHAEATT